MNNLPEPSRDPRLRGGVETHQALCRLLRRWCDDPDRLAVALAAWSLAGYNPAFAVDEVAMTHGDTQAGWAWDRCDAALFRRERRLLRARAEGLLLALSETGAGFEFERLHAAQVEAHVRECREVDMPERLARLRADGRGREVVAHSREGPA